MVSSWTWWLISTTSAPGRLKYEERKFEASPGYIVRPCLKIMAKM
jgi:hypothetical protein